ncbi:MAG TPA: hypothetical protein VG409_16760 [Actinomycetota bacterium]|nr:hypothetical protein [Actinomycetota bacterium]
MLTPILAHGISTSFQLAVAFAALAFVVALVVIRPKPSDQEAVEAPAAPGAGGS